MELAYYPITPEVFQIGPFGHQGRACWAILVQEGPGGSPASPMPGFCRNGISYININYGEYGTCIFPHNTQNNANWPIWTPGAGLLGDFGPVRAWWWSWGVRMAVVLLQLTILACKWDGQPRFLTWVAGWLLAAGCLWLGCGCGCGCGVVVVVL